MNEELLNSILQSPRLPTPPSVALQVIDLVQDPAVSTVALASTIGADPALAARPAYREFKLLRAGAHD